MKIDHYFPVKKLSPFMVLVAGGSMFLVKGRLPQDSLDGEVDVSNSAVQCEIKFSELISLSVNKNNQDVTVLYGPRRFEHDTAAFTLESAEAREAFLDIVARRLPGGFAREEEGRCRQRMRKLSNALSCIQSRSFRAELNQGSIPYILAPDPQESPTSTVRSREMD